MWSQKFKSCEIKYQNFIFKFILQVLFVCFFCNMADIPTEVHFCPNPVKHALIHLLYGSCNPDLHVACWQHPSWSQIMRNLMGLSHMTLVTMGLGHYGHFIWTHSNYKITWGYTAHFMFIVSINAAQKNLLLREFIIILYIHIKVTSVFKITCPPDIMVHWYHSCFIFVTCPIQIFSWGTS